MYILVPIRRDGNISHLFISLATQCSMGECPPPSILKTFGKTYCFTNISFFSIFLGLGLPVQEEEKKEYSRMFSIEHGSFCGKQFKQQQIGWQGHGQVGVATGWKEEIDHPGACCHAHFFD